MLHLKGLKENTIAYKGLQEFEFFSNLLGTKEQMGKKIFFSVNIPDTIIK